MNTAPIASIIATEAVRRQVRSAATDAPVESVSVPRSQQVRLVRVRNVLAVTLHRAAARVAAPAPCLPSAP